MTLDLNTLFVIGACVAVAALVLLVVVCYEADRERLAWWIALGGAAALALALPIWRDDPVPAIAWLARVSSNMAASAIYSCLLAALAVLASRRVSSWVLIAGPALIGLLHFFPAFDQDINLRRVGAATVACVYLVICALMFASDTRSSRPAKQAFHERLIVGVLWFHAVVSALRIVVHSYAWVIRSDELANAWHTAHLIEGIIVGILLLGGVLGYEARGIRRQLEHKAAVDSLTGALNRGAFIAQLTRNVEVEGKDGALMIFDLDYFKRVNDTFGHAVGDRVLCEFARIAQEAVGDAGFIGRIGGEEFSCFIPEAAGVLPLGIAEEIRWTLMRENLLGAQTVTVSIGIANAKDSDWQVKRLLDLADHALYRSKHTGRNRISVHQPPGGVGSYQAFAPEI